LHVGTRDYERACVEVRECVGASAIVAQLCASGPHRV
jgi:hypothetical protein